jgi:hypothetical protein
LKLNNSISLQEEKTGTSIKSIYFVSETDWLILSEEYPMRLISREWDNYLDNYFAKGQGKGCCGCYRREIRFMRLFEEWIILIGLWEGKIKSTQEIEGYAEKTIKKYLKESCFTKTLNCISKIISCLWTNNNDKRQKWIWWGPFSGISKKSCCVCCGTLITNIPMHFLTGCACKKRKV